MSEQIKNIIRKISANLFLVFLLFAGTGQSLSATEMAITIDDFNLSDSPKLTAKEKDESILQALDKHGVKAGLFVTTKNLRSKFERDRLSIWNKKGHLIGNHTHSHKGYHNTSFEEFSQDIKRAETILEGYDGFRKLFRFPYLKEGNTREKRDLMRKFLTSNGYSQGYVTIDASDWYISSRLEKRLRDQPNADISEYRKFYLDHLWQRAQFYEELSKKAWGKPVKHTLLLHHNLASALFLDDLIKSFKDNGWSVISASAAFTDPVFNEAPDIVPTGESIVWAVAKATGKFEQILRYPGESDEYEKAEMDAKGL